MKLTIVLAITLAMGAFWFVVDHYYQNSNEPNFPCQDCLAAARQVAQKLTASQESSKGKQGRRLPKMLSEATILSALNSTCDLFQDDAKLGASCTVLVALHRQTIESAVFAMSDYSMYSRLLCSEVFKVCDPHEIAAPQEL